MLVRQQRAQQVVCVELHQQTALDNKVSKERVGVEVSKMFSGSSGNSKPPHPCIAAVLPPLLTNPPQTHHHHHQLATRHVC